jgi:cytochrome c peroxidase
VLVPFLVLVTSVAVRADTNALLAQARQFFSPLPERVEADGVELTEARIRLGRKSFFEPRLSRNRDITCNTCHRLDDAGVDGRQKAIGHNGAVGRRNTPTVFNSALHIGQFWDARVRDVETQALHPIVSPDEMALHPDDAVRRLTAIEEYRMLFAAAFPNDPEPLRFQNIGVAIGAFLRTLTTPSRFDRFLEGDTAALDEKEQQGLRTFLNRGCILCHNGVAVGGQRLQRFGVHHPYWEHTGSEHIDDGRYTVTGRESERYVFKVPSLRNVTRTAPYFHDGSVARLEDAVRVMAAVQLNERLSDRDVESIVRFLDTLSGEPPAQAVAEPVLPGLPSPSAPIRAPDNARPAALQHAGD